MLHSSYMPFVKGGGIFIPTEKSFELGDEVFVLLTILEDPERFAITGKVVWINHRTTPGSRQMGVGIQFSGMDGANLQKKIEAQLAGYIRAAHSTNTM